MSSDSKEVDRSEIEPALQKTYRLEDLLKEINARNLHEPVDFGPPLGKEFW